MYESGNASKMRCPNFACDAIKLDNSSAGTKKLAGPQVFNDNA
jgi:hypothetical protein